jgi:hypothetical protein
MSNGGGAVGLFGLGAIAYALYVIGYLVTVFFIGSVLLIVLLIAIGVVGLIRYMKHVRTAWASGDGFWRFDVIMAPLSGFAVAALTLVIAYFFFVNEHLYIKGWVEHLTHSELWHQWYILLIRAAIGAVLAGVTFAGFYWSVHGLGFPQRRWRLASYAGFAVIAIYMAVSWVWAIRQ